MGSRTDEVAVGLAVVMLISVPAPFRSTAHSPQGQLPVGTPKVISSDAANGVETFASPRFIPRQCLSLRVTARRTWPYPIREDRLHVGRQKVGAGHAAHAAAGLRQSQSRHARDGCLARLGHR